MRPKTKKKRRRRRGRLAIETVHQFADGRLQRRRIVNLDNRLPPRRRQHRTIERDGDLAAQRRGNVIQHTHPGLGLELRQFRGEVRVTAANDLEDFLHDVFRILHHHGIHHARVGRNKFQRPHGSRCGQPRRYPVRSDANVSAARFSVLPPTSRRSIIRYRTSPIPGGNCPLLLSCTCCATICSMSAQKSQPAPCW